MNCALPTRLRGPLLFGVAGVLALGLDIGVLGLLTPWLGLYGARALSFLAAASFTWLFNRRLTFAGPRRLGLRAEYAAYLASMAMGGAVNLLVYAVTVWAWPLAAAHPALGVALGSLSGMVFNFLAARAVLVARH